MDKKDRYQRFVINVKYLKTFCVNKIKGFIKKRKLEFKRDAAKKYIYVFLAADYGNLGDVAITFAQKKFLCDNLHDYEIKEIPMSQTYEYISLLKRKVQSNDIITINGGGNMTDIYDGIEEMRRMIIKSFKKNKIISFPQTINFSSTIFGEEAFKRTKKVYNKHRNLYLFAREKMSYEVMANNFNNVFLCPDIVFYLSGILNCNTRRKIGICFRNDRELLCENEKNKKCILNQISSDDISQFDTHIGDANLLFNNKEEVLIDFLKKIGENKLIITDRLHGLIFSYITNTPCIVFDNSNHKIKSTIDTWLKDINSVRLIENDDIIDLKDFLNIKNDNSFNFNGKFNELINIISEKG